MSLVTFEFVNDAGGDKRTVTVPLEVVPPDSALAAAARFPRVTPQGQQVPQAVRITLPHPFRSGVRLALHS